MREIVSLIFFIIFLFLVGGAWFIGSVVEFIGDTWYAVPLLIIGGLFGLVAGGNE